MKTLYAILFGLLFIVLMGLWLERNSLIRQIQIEQERIPWPSEVQKKLKDIGLPRYDPGKIDGDPGPLMRQAWLNYTFDYKYADKYVSW